MDDRNFNFIDFKVNNSDLCTSREGDIVNALNFMPIVRHCTEDV